MRTTPLVTAARAALCAALAELGTRGMAAHADWIKGADGARMLASLCDDAALGCNRAAKLYRTSSGPCDDRAVSVAKSSRYARAAVAAECLAAAVRAVIGDDAVDADRLAREAVSWLATTGTGG